MPAHFNKYLNKKYFILIGFIVLFLFLLLVISLSKSCILGCRGCCRGNTCYQLGQKTEDNYICSEGGKWQKSAEESPVGTTDGNENGQISDQTPGDTVIATQGSENIYQSDLVQELSYYPFADSPVTREQLLTKIKADSDLLQQAESTGNIVLDSSVYNSPDKDYLKRISLVNEIKNKNNQSSDTISGTVIAIWFNNLQAGDIGYDQGKLIAQNEISRLHNLVASNEISIDDAADQIINNTNLAQIDPSYKSNAKFRFTAKPGDKITLDPELDSAIWNLKNGELSNVYLIKDKMSNGESIDSVFMFVKRESSK